MPTDKRQFLRMNSDDSPLAVPNGDALLILNCRVHPTFITTTPGNTLVPENIFESAVQTFTASCPVGSTGEPVTATATDTSFLSYEDANVRALAKAKALAESQLVCTPVPMGWRVQASSAYCVQGENGNTGLKGWNTLERYVISSGAATGAIKTNVEGQPDYIAPVPNETDCPVQTANQLSIWADIFGPSAFNAVSSRNDTAGTISVFWEYRYTTDLGEESIWLRGDTPITIMSGEVQGQAQQTIMGGFISTLEIRLTQPIPEGYTL